MTTASAIRLEKPHILTMGDATEGGSRGRKVNGTPAPEVNGMLRLVPNTPKQADANATPRRKHKPHKPHRRACKGCGEKFQPTRKGQIHCSEACRKRVYRQNAQKRGHKKPAPAPDELQVIARCPYCKQAFWRAEGSKQEYCKPSHRTMASKARRAASIEALQREFALSEPKAHEFLETFGLVSVSRKLIALGFRYDDNARAWVKPVALVVEREVYA